LKFSVLLKKWAGKINVFAMALWVPLIAPPAFVAIYRKRLIGMVKRNYFFAAHIACSVIKSKVIAPSQPSLQTAFGTESRWRNFDFFIKSEIVGLDGKIGFAILAYFIFGFIFHFG